MSLTGRESAMWGLTKPRSLCTSCNEAISVWVCRASLYAMTGVPYLSGHRIALT